MDLKDIIKNIGDRVAKNKDKTQTEEATKMAFIVPFIQALGYDVSNPDEVVPEYVTDIGTKKGEKIDFAILKNGIPSILIECKHHGEQLDVHEGQLLRYFNVSPAKFGVLTNGVKYRFYTETAEPNKMDEKPFLEFDITCIRDTEIESLKGFHKSQFDVERVQPAAAEMKYLTDIKTIITEEMSCPTEEFVKMLIRGVYKGKATVKIIEQFKEITKKACYQYINELITDRLNAALTKEREQDKITQKSQKEEAVSKEGCKKDGIITTQEEIDGFNIVRAILTKYINNSRIFVRDAKSCCSILLDDNIKKPICRFYFDGRKKYLETVDADKNRTKNEIQSTDDIFNFEKQLLNIVQIYDGVVESESKKDTNEF